MKPDIQKQIISLRFLLMGKGFFRASRALEDVLRIHKGLRKDGITPEYVHQLSITHYLRTFLDYCMNPENTIIAALLHDTFEDYPHIMDIDAIDRKYGTQATESIRLLTKTGKASEHYFDLMVKDPIASIVKGADRIHNFQTMVDVFSTEKQAKYIKETEDFILPMLERASLEFPEQEPIYANEQLVLCSQIELIRAIHKAEDILSKKV